MRNNLAREDLDAVCHLLQQQDPILTQSKNVASFEGEWSAWLGVCHSVMVNSGSSANLLSMAALKILKGGGEVIVPPLTWVSDIASVLHAGLEPVFVDIDPRTLGMDNRQVMEKIGPRTRAVFLTHVLGYNGLSQELLDGLAAHGIPLVEDVCESHGATFCGRKLGALGWMSNFSFYYAHHLTTVEGGMISTNDPDVYEVLRMLRSHGMVRECRSQETRVQFHEKHPDLSPDFIFAYPAYNVRSTEINAVIGRSQLKRLDAGNESRRQNLALFLANLDSAHYFTDFAVEGSSNYAFTLVLKRPDTVLRDAVESAMKKWGVEFRRGTAGGGNQLRQPYLQFCRDRFPLEKFPNVEHIHSYGWYIGNYPGLPLEKITALCAALNRVASESE